MLLKLAVLEGAAFRSKYCLNWRCWKEPLSAPNIAFHSIFPYVVSVLVDIAEIIQAIKEMVSVRCFLDSITFRQLGLWTDLRPLETDGLV